MPLSLETLNPPQREAVLHEGGPLVVFAGAGSGKTRVITYRVASLVGDRGVKPWRILAVTFTNKAAGEMRERLHHLVMGGAARDLWVGTFHATCARLLRRYHEPIGIRRDFVIYDEGDQRAMITRVVRDLGLDEKRWPAKSLAGAIERAKQEAIAPDRMETTTVDEEIVQRVYAAYEQRMRAAGALDFGDLIWRLVDASEDTPALREELQQRFDHVLVDEFQDTNHVQYRFVRLLVANHQNLCVVGDDDQSIYRWRGADRRNILDFQNEFPDARVVKLEQNYRSTQRILRAAYAVISRNLDREPKQLWTDNAAGPKVLVVRCEDERDEARVAVRAVRELRAEGRALKDVAIFYRIHAQSRVFEEALRALDIPYRVVGGIRFYERAEIKDALAYLRVLTNRDDDVSLLRIVNVPPRGIGKTTIDRLLDLATMHGTSVWSAIERGAEDPQIATAARKKLGQFRDLIQDLAARASTEKLSDFAQSVLSETGYLEMLRNEDTPEADARLENLNELVGSMKEFEAEAESPTLSSFLELVTLQTSEDGAAADDVVTLMTVHAAKGLEFPVVIVAGLEEEMFPYRTNDPEELEEERRLAYVAFTRARERLILSHVGMRRLFGQPRVNPQSRFLDELPQEDVETVGEAPVPRWTPNPYQQYQPRQSWPGMRSSRPSAPARAPARNTPSERESWIDRSDADAGGDAADAPALRRGMRVRHTKYGVGEVRAVSGQSAEVKFPGWGVKKIVLTYLERA